MIAMITGLPGASKSYYSAQQAVEWIERNKKWHSKTGKVRVVYSNLQFSQEFYDWANEHHEFLKYWEDPEELPHINNADVIWEEMGAHVDSRSWEQLPLQLRRWLQQHRHRGVEILGNCQDFADIDVAVRRLVGSLTYLIKLAGSRDPSPTSLPPRLIWGFILKLSLAPREYKSDEMFKNSTIAGIGVITKKGVELYSMHNDIKPGKFPPLQHRARTCPDCGYLKVIHV